jgi:hypothetical protein
MISPKPRRLVDCELVEYSKIVECGEERVRYEIEEKHGFSRCPKMSRRGTLDDITVTRDRDRLNGDRRSTRTPAGFSSFWRFNLSCPVGTKVTRYTDVPDSEASFDEYVLDEPPRIITAELLYVTVTGALSSKDPLRRLAPLRLVREPKVAREEPTPLKESGERAASIAAFLESLADDPTPPKPPPSATQVMDSVIAVIAIGEGADDIVEGSDLGE